MKKDSFQDRIVSKILDSKFVLGIVKINHDIKKAKNDPKNNFTNNHPPDLEITME